MSGAEADQRAWQANTTQPCRHFAAAMAVWCIREGKIENVPADLGVKQPGEQSGR